MLLFLFLLPIEYGGYLLSHLRSTGPFFSLLRKRWPSGPSRSHTHFAPIVLNLRKSEGCILQELDYGIGER